MEKIPNKLAIDLAILMTIEVGHVFNNYKEMCLAFQAPILGGNFKKKQLKVWNEQLKLRKEKFKYIVEAVYLDVVPTTMKVSKEVEVRMFLLLADVIKSSADDWDEGMFTDEYTNSCIYSLNQILLAIGACNENYKTNYTYYDNRKLINTPQYNKIYKTSIFKDIPFWEFVEFYEEVSNRGRQLVRTLISAVNRSYLAKINKIYSIRATNAKKYVKATESQEQAIRATICAVLSSDKYLISEDTTVREASEKDIYLQGKVKEFYADVCASKWFTDNGISSFKPAYEILYTGTLCARLLRYREINNLAEGLEDNLLQARESSKAKTVQTYIEKKKDGKYLVAREFMSALLCSKDTESSFDTFAAQEATYLDMYEEIRAKRKKMTFEEFLAEAAQ